MTLPTDWVPCLRLAAVLSVESGMVVVLAMALARFTRGVLWHRAIWQAATLALLWLTVGEVTGIGRHLAGWTRAFVRLEARKRIESTGVQRQAAELALPAPALTEQFRQKVSERLQRAPAQAVETLDWPHGLAQRAGAGLDPSIEPFFQGHSLPWPELIWSAGAVAALGPACLARLFFHGFGTRQRRVFDGALLQRVTALARRLRIRRRIRVVEASGLKGPVAFGIFRPTIGLPKDFSQRFSPVQQEVMLAHELAHVAGFDPAWQGLADLTASLLWWNPLGWWTRSQLRITAENAADEASLLVRDGPGVVAECLLQLAAHVGPQPLGVFGATGPGFRSALGRRIEKLVELGGRSWSPLSRVHSGLMQAVVPMGLVLAAIFGTAWAAPQTKGDPMTTLKTTWKRSLATVALFAAAATEPTVNLKANPAAHDSAGVKRARLEQSAEPRATLVAAASSPAPADAVNKAQAPAVAAPVAEPGAEEETPGAPSIYRMDPRLLERYGLKPPGKPSAARASAVRTVTSRGKQQIENKLNETVLNEVKWEGLPLTDVIKLLEEASRQRDPSKPGINFLVTNVPETPTPASSGIDPTTGIPIPAPAADITSAIIRLHLRDVRLKDALDALCRVSDQPIKYTVEEYGIVFSPAGGPAVNLSAGANHATEAPRLQVRTFRVDTNTFVAGLGSAFGIAVRPETSPAQDIQQALRQLLQQLGINLDVPGKAVFYNELTGIVMVRGTAEDLELVQAAIETLGGRLLRLGSANASRSTMSNTASVLGKVNREGTIDLPADAQISLLDAIARAGGFSTTANRNKIELSRQGASTTYRFDTLKKAQADQQVWLEPGDVVLVHEAVF